MEQGLVFLENMGNLDNQDSLHELRLAGKRLRALSAIVYPNSNRKQPPLSRAMDELYKAAGRLRDHDVMIFNCQDMPNVDEAFVKQLQSRTPDLAYRVRIAAGHFDKQSFEYALKDLVNDLMDLSHNTNEADAIQLFTRKHLKAGRRIIRLRKRNNALHEARKHLKQCITLLGVYFDKKSIARFKKLEQAIGNWHDQVMWTEHLRNFNTTSWNQTTAALIAEETQLSNYLRKTFKKEFLKLRWKYVHIDNPQNASPKAM